MIFIWVKFNFKYLFAEFGIRIVLYVWSSISKEQIKSTDQQLVDPSLSMCFSLLI